MTTIQRLPRHLSRLVLGIALVGGCGGPEAGDATSAGVSAPLANGFPAGGVGVVRLQVTNGNVLSNGKLDDETCTGTVISADRIITAGHCFNKWLTIKDHHDTTVLLQGDLLAGAEYTRDGTSWTCLQSSTRADCPPSLLAPVHVTRLGNGDFPPDIAVVRFATPFNGISPVEFRQLSTHEVRVKQSVEVWGIGYTDPNGTGGATVSNAMMRAVMRIAGVNGNQLQIDNSGRAQLCKGDSGGPLFAGPSDLIVGVVSQGLARNGACELVIDKTNASRITAAAITLVDNNRGPNDPLCRETIAGTGFFACY
jgi:hypothetical protein